MTDQPSQAPSSSLQPSATLLTQLQGLTQPSLVLPPAYLHPYAPLLGNNGPAGWKGKGKETADSVQAQLEMVKAMKACVEQAKTRLSQREGDWGKLSRALKEVVSHQDILLPLSTSLSPACLRPNKAPLLPSSRIALPPVQLLPALAQSQDIQTYHEESQFGLLKSTLTLAGNCFVVDIDLETDAAAEEDEAGSTSVAAGTGGSVRLSKIAVSYVTIGGGMEASEYVAGVLRSAVEEYLLEWNMVVETLVGKGQRGKRLERCIRRIEGLLAEVKALDGDVHVEGAEGGEQAGFTGLESIAKRFEALISDAYPIYSVAQPTICPSFSLSPSHDLSMNPNIRIRPRQPGESVPVPPRSSSKGHAQSTMDSTKWILEIPDGIVVRRNWLGGPEGVSNTWDGGIKIENLLYTPASESTASQVNPFPYQSTFVHDPKSASKHLQQHWSLSSPGPDGYVVGRIGLPDSDEELRHILLCLGKQLQMNRSFQSVFTARCILAHDAEESAANEDDDMEDLLADPVAIPITVSHTQQGMVLECPLPHSESGTLHLDISSGQNGAAQRCDVGGVTNDKQRALALLAAPSVNPTNLVELFRAIEGALRA